MDTTEHGERGRYPCPYCGCDRYERGYYKRGLWSDERITDKRYASETSTGVVVGRIVSSLIKRQQFTRVYSVRCVNCGNIGLFAPD